MAYKILFAVALLFAFVGTYHMTWKDIPHPYLQVMVRGRKANLAWCCFFLALVASIAGFFTL